MIEAAEGVTIDGQGFITIAVGLLGFLGVLVTYLGTRGKTTADAKAALDKRIDDRVETQLKGAWADIDKLKVHSTQQDAKIKDLEERDKQKSSIFRRIFSTLAAMLPTTPQIELVTSEIELVGDTIDPTWIKHLKENP